MVGHGRDVRKQRCSSSAVAMSALCCRSCNITRGSFSTKLRCGLSCLSKASPFSARGRKPHLAESAGDLEKKIALATGHTNPLR